MNRPTGVTILGWVAVVFGAIGLVVGVMAVFAGMALMALGAGVAGVGGVVGGASIAGGAFLVLALAVWMAVLSAVEIAFGVGALQLRPWAWTLGMIWTWVSVASSILSLVANRGSGLVSALISIIVAIAILYYLYTDEVKAAFGKSSQVPPSFMVPVFEQIDKMLASNKGGAQPPTQPPAPPAPPAQ